MLIKAEMDSVLFDANEELKKRDMRIEHLEEQNKEFFELIVMKMNFEINKGK